MGVIFAALAAIAVSVLGRVLADEFKAFRPTIVEFLVRRAVNKLPEDMQERYAEEWSSYLEDVPGDVAKIWTAFGYNLVAGRLGYSFYSWEVSAKRLLDVLIGGSALFLLAPLFLLIALLIWAGDGRAPIFRHARIGQHGRIFGCLKFRTMVPNGAAVLEAHLAANSAARIEWLATRKLTDDPRVTPIGKILRKTSLDELPQLYNVWRGEMSLVGPRPIISEEIEQYGEYFATCFSVKPGISGLSQILWRPEVTYVERVAHDLEYASNWSLRRDIAIMVLTFPAALRQRSTR